MPAAAGWAAQVLSPGGGLKWRSRWSPLGFCLSGLLCLVLAVLKLAGGAHWSWWRVSLPFWAVLGHNILYIIVGFVWLSFADDGAAEEATIPLDSDGSYTYQVVAPLWLLVFADNLLGRPRGNWGDLVVRAQIGLVGGDRGVRCAQLGLPASVLVTVVPAVNRRNWEE